MKKGASCPKPLGMDQKKIALGIISSINRFLRRRVRDRGANSKLGPKLKVILLRPCLMGIRIVWKSFG